ncbi:TIGR03084 family protein [Amycolatopsis marina]|uniref:TIGR03084 family protein n=1 Tax=Amycolatopsis marina TaxID=490629 RepID=A0A1I0Z5T1_9PSEU|nr:TIGR03084 family metal-binding protein [Amycolatopsis marina]SFB20456.1 TIGR03084 family protein [Amycolatopsis marina]
MADLGAILDDLAAQGQEVDDLVAGLSDAQWRQPTPAAGWTIAHQVGHLAWTDAQSLTAASSPDDFSSALEHLVARGSAYVDEVAEEWAGLPREELMRTWRAGRGALAEALAAVPAGTKLPWFGPPMSAASMATARIMETWAHGQDIADALGVPLRPGDRLWHVARIGVRTRDFAFLANSLAPPGEEFRVELAAPGGGTWTFGPGDAANRVTGSAVDFCLLVTQRRHRDDTDLVADGDSAREWLGIAQAFAGPPGSGRMAGQFS